MSKRALDTDGGGYPNQRMRVETPANHPSKAASLKDGVPPEVLVRPLALRDIDRDQRTLTIEGCH
jgi:hypothetical protein